MEHPVRPLKERRNRAVVTDIRFHNSKMNVPLMMLQILQPSRAAVIDDNNIMPLGKQPIHDMRSDESAAARNNRFHFIVPPAHRVP